MTELLKVYTHTIITNKKSDMIIYSETSDLNDRWSVNCAIFYGVGEQIVHNAIEVTFNSKEG